MKKDIKTRVRIYSIGLSSEGATTNIPVDFSLENFIEEFGNRIYGVYFYEIKEIQTKKISNEHYKIIYTAHHLFAEEYNMDPNIPQIYEYDLFIKND